MEPLERPAPAIWDEPRMHRALARRDITTVYRLLQDYGWAQRHVSHLTGQSQSEVSAILKGRQVVSYAVFERLADNLGIPRGHMGLAYTDAEGNITAYPDPAPSDPALALEDDMRRRKLLIDAVTAALGVAVFQDDAFSRLPLTDDDPLPTRIGPPDVAAVRSATEAWRKLDHDYGGASVHDAVSVSAQRLTKLLGAQAQPQVHRDLLIAAAHQHSLAGSTAADAGMYDRARWHFKEGLTLAGQSSDLRTIGWMLDDIGRMELIRGEPDEALKAFQLAAARMEPWPVLKSLMAGAYADLDQAKEARKQLKAATESDMSVGGLDGQSGHVLLRLGDLPGAVAHLESSLASREDALVKEGRDDARARCVEHASLAAAHLRAGNLVAGTNSAEQCFRLAQNLRSRNAKTSLGGLYKVLVAPPRSHDSTCRDLAHRVRQLARSG